MARKKPPPEELPPGLPAGTHLEQVKESLIQGTATLPHLSELAEHFIRLQGGPQAVAMMLKKEWDEANPGSIVRARILEMLLRTWKIAEDKTENLSDLGLLTKADLDREIDERLKEITKEPPVDHDPSKPRWPDKS